MIVVAADSSQACVDAGRVSLRCHIWRGHAGGLRSRALSADEWNQRCDDLAIDVVDHRRQSAWNLDASLSPNLDTNHRGTVNSHVHGVGGDVEEFCFVVENVVGVDDAINAPE